MIRAKVKLFFGNWN